MIPPPPPRQNRLAEERYRALIEREARHWGHGGDDPPEPQLWDDPELFRIALAPAYQHLVELASGHGRVLELGCGDGDLALEIASRGATVTGLDLSLERIGRATEGALARGLSQRATFQVADLNRAELPPAAYDCVVAHDALHHVLELGHVLDQAHRTLVAGGRLVVSDFIGTGRLERLVWVACYAVLPTVRPYRVKWNLRERLPAFLSSEQERRRSLEEGDDALHEPSPFEGISQGSIDREIASRFEIVERFTFCPQWYHLVPRLRLPAAGRRALLRFARPFDRALHRSGLARGSYVFINARKRQVP